MDEIELLRRVRADQAEPSRAAVESGRDALVERARSAGGAATVGPRARKRIRVGWSLLTAITVGAVATAVIVTGGFSNDTGPAAPPPAAAAVLQDAAEAAIATRDPVVQPGQYLRIETQAVYSSTALLSDTEAVSWLEGTHDVLYVPANRDEDWVLEKSAREVVETFGAESERLAEEQAASGMQGPGFVDELLRAPGGTFYGMPATEDIYDFESLPRDPAAMYAHITAANADHGGNPDARALVFIADLLRSGPVPADIRAALFGAAALVPSITITDQDARQGGRSGVAIGIEQAGTGNSQEIVIDPDTGELIGERQVQNDGLGGIPPGTTVGSTTVTTTVVDDAPAGGTQGGALGDFCEHDPATGAITCT
ncbi:CU044_5270 family protein [Pseudoclavibacter terrae]|uniref:CU044_5270 family protein n=1 Tax=Pseudoclavibacter terrae TaxID=1530195 RepID=A0A7J5B4B5_9MICO|nr:CU044_5270 family protein [Pseudoclavibacter terrae]KAB1639022.1 hypothetical protein F8O03_01325 [Pseudoclavibacter terrae]